MSVSEFLQMLPVFTGIVGGRDPRLESSLLTGQWSLGAGVQNLRTSTAQGLTGLPRAVIFKLFEKLSGLLKSSSSLLQG